MMNDGTTREDLMNFEIVRIAFRNTNAKLFEGDYSYPTSIDIETYSRTPGINTDNQPARVISSACIGKAFPILPRSRI